MTAVLTEDLTAQPDAGSGSAGNGSCPPAWYDTLRKSNRTDEEVLAGILRQVRSFRDRVAHGDGYTLAKLLDLEEKISAETDLAIAQLHESGMPYRDIGLANGRTKQWAIMRLRRAGLLRRSAS